MFGVLMVGFHASKIPSTSEIANRYGRYFSYYGFLLLADESFAGCCCTSDGVLACIVCGIGWLEAVCIDYHKVVGLDRRYPPGKGAKPTD